ncbi:hypothetical protein F5148DRAFT_1378857 [Russula earlei]|uniref:Uncharacterized protein n=1 Tax=Russula earlei TaxID=71964 RepID=A0ACC0TW43_9AGAM|nr:hypothetical protein F5148DRAFT_1378857 [Russula earlei]
MGNLISRNNSGVDLTLTFPDGQVTAFENGVELNSPETGEFLVTQGTTPIYTFTLYQGIHITDITSIQLNGVVTFKNNTSEDLTLVLPTGVATAFPKGQTFEYSNTGTYSVHAGPSLPTPIYDFKYHRGYVAIDVNEIVKQPPAKAN